MKLSKKNYHHAESIFLYLYLCLEVYKSCIHLINREREWDIGTVLKFSDWQQAEIRKHTFSIFKGQTSTLCFNIYIIFTDLRGAAVQTHHIHTSTTDAIEEEHSLPTREVLQVKDNYLLPFSVFQVNSNIWSSLVVNFTWWRL